MKALALLLCVSAVHAQGQTEAPPLTVWEKAKIHASWTGSPGALAEIAVYAAVLHGMDTPREWGQSAEAYGWRMASATSATGIRNVFAFTLDSALHEDPRYDAIGEGGAGRRFGHALSRIFVTRTDRGGRRIATWRIASAFGAAWLSNAWYPDRLNTFSSGVWQGGATLGLDLLGNIGAEFWPSVKRGLSRRKP